jgi:outer membrane protein insertion porin family
MKRVWREVLLGAVSCVATVGVGGGAWIVNGVAEAQGVSTTPTQPPSAAEPAARDAAPAAPQAPLEPKPVTAAPRPAAPRSAAQPRTTTPAKPAPVAQVIRRIDVQGSQRVEPSTVISYLLVQPGDPFDAERIDLSLKTLFATGLFADVQIIQQGPDLVVKVVENPIINRVVFEGLHAIKQDNVEKDLQAKPRAVFTAARAQADVQRIIEVYRRSGRFAATVTPQVKELDQNRVDLIFKIDEGPVTHVRSINFIGNRAFSDRTLRDAIKTEQSRWWKILSSNDNYDPDRMEYDRELLRQYYTNRGYADFRIVSAVAELTPDQKGFYITFTVDEGEKYNFGAINVETELDKLPKDLLKAAVPIHSGREFQGELVEKSIDALTFVAGTAGYANVDIRPRIDRDREAKKVNITFEVNEGPRVFIERINVVGNNQTVDQVVRRELRLSEGDAFNRVLLDRSKNRVKALGFFKDVDITDKPGSQADRAIVDVKVTEEPTGELAFAAGYSSSDSFLFDVSVTQRNLRGRGQYLRLRASTSSRRKEVDLRFTEPRFLGRNLAAGFDLFTLNTDYLNISSFENQSTGFSLRASFPLASTTSLGLTYTLRQDDTKIASLLIDLDGDPTTTNDIVDQCDPLNVNRSILCDQAGKFMTSVASYAFDWDTRNDPIKPTRGFDVSLRQDFAGLGGQVKYLRTEVGAGVYRGIVRNLTASFNVNAGYIFGWGSDDVRINDRFFKGGSSFRGFDIAGIGPRQLVLIDDGAGNITTLKGDALGGKVYGVGTLQLEFPLGLPKEFGLSGALFTEFGTLGLLDAKDRRTVGPIVQADGSIVTSTVKDNAALRASAGLSIFWDSPFGPVQFDFAEPFAKEDYDKTQNFRFSTRTSF